jgi:uncharacterized protein (DUF1778 family)
MQLDKQLQKHIFSLPIELKAEVLDFVLFLEQKLKNQQKSTAINNVIQLNVKEQENFAKTLLNPVETNAKLKKSAQRYQQKMKS